ncbi:polycystic kidney disease 2-like 2 protein [Carcharodon carcharias]|uniref:polycystic kidney disease 2-like 2 protein n=1 Tax=Carcharodon carcharias TaxID=13397 RepID=UPI001B7DC44A|nr:polycystic kidney disease 2-like 2 protein [Carcharodon carcharias]
MANRLLGSLADKFKIHNRRKKDVVRAIYFRKKELNPKSTLREFSFYLIFLLDLSILTFGMVNTNMYFFTKVMSHLFLETNSFVNGINFKSISSIENFWEYAEGPLLDSLYWKEWYNGQPLSQGKSYIYYENILLGRPQIRQIRVRNNSCSIHEYFQKMFKDCHDAYSFATEDQSPFGPRTGAEWEYRLPNNEFELWHWGRLGTYSNGGYIFELAQDKVASLGKIKRLKSKLWLDSGSRAVFIDFTVYNANVNLFSAIRLLVEFPATGGAIPSSEFFTVKLLRYVSHFDFFLAACEVIFCFFICNQVIQEAIELHIHRMAYFKNFWNWLDFLIVLFSLLAIFYNIYRTIKVSLLLEKLLENSDTYQNLYFLAYWQNRYNVIIAFTVFIAWIKIFKYISFNMTMTQLSTTLSRCAKGIVGFAIMFFIVFFGYAQLGYLIFGTRVEHYHTFGNCIFTQFRIILGDFDFHEIEEANQILGPIYFITFVFSLFFVLLNVFLAIINDTYSEVKDDKTLQEVDFDIIDVFRKGYNNVLLKLNIKKPFFLANRSAKGGQKSQQNDFEKDEDDEQNLTESKMRILHRQNIANKYDNDPVLEPTVHHKPAKNSDQQTTAKDYQFLMMRTGQLEERMNEMNSKIDWIMEQLEKQRSVRSRKQVTTDITDLN